MPGSKQAWPDHRRLLISGNAADRNRRAEHVRIGHAKLTGRIGDDREARIRVRNTRTATQQLARPIVALCNIETASNREALVASVACVTPPVSRQIKKLSTVPNASSPRSARARAPGRRVKDRR